MAAGEVIFVIALNCIIIFLLYKFQQRALEKRMKHLKNEIQDLEDLVAAIIEEFQEIAQVTEAKANDVKKAILESAPIIESDLPIPKEPIHQYTEITEINSTVVTPDIAVTSDISELSNIINVSSKDFSNDSEVMNHQISVNKNTRPVSDVRHQRILELWEQGVSIEEIAKNLGTGRGEVQLILGIYRRS